MLSHETVVAVLSQLGAEIQINNTRSGNAPVMRTTVRRKDTKAKIHQIDVPGSDPLQAIQAAVEEVAKLNNIPTDSVTEMELLRRKMEEMQKAMDAINQRNVQSPTATPEPSPAPAPESAGSTTGPGHVAPPPEVRAEAPAAPKRRGSVAPLTQ